MTSHLVRRAAEVPEPPYDELGHRRRTLVGEDDGSVHTGFGLCELRPDGRVTPRVRSRSILRTTETTSCAWPGLHTRPTSARAPARRRRRRRRAHRPEGHPATALHRVTAAKLPCIPHTGPHQVG
ncbi:hypothetical protein QQY66_48730 [Streptomyces sp. DG2A-72]|uniref:hypothetical protein n=1 Tax=Streptomyces sp. DG2A-72 TaxID=3051386 RepID=UPI00265C72BE|nr:hypothetical protein [Streptomyces sp. DG2A-72]MDO0939204.1 hypothetical protein [Streptomyces sp. DG2A-72]